VTLVRTDVSVEYIFSILRMKRISEVRKSANSNYQLANSSHPEDENDILLRNVASKKTAFFIVTAVTTRLGSVKETLCFP
jgi:hypothetical protein